MRRERTNILLYTNRWPLITSNLHIAIATQTRFSTLSRIHTTRRTLSPWLKILIKFCGKCNRTAKTQMTFRSSAGRSDRSQRVMYSVKAEVSSDGRGLLSAMGPVLRGAAACEEEALGNTSGSMVPGLVVDWRRGRKKTIFHGLLNSRLLYIDNEDERETTLPPPRRDDAHICICYGMLCVGHERFCLVRHSSWCWFHV